MLSKLSFPDWCADFVGTRYPFNLDSVLHLHNQQTLLSQQDFVDKCEDCQPENRRDVDTESRRDASLHQSQQGFGRPGDYCPRKFIKIGFGVPGCDHTAQLKHWKERGGKAAMARIVRKDQQDQFCSKHRQFFPKKWVNHSQKIQFNMLGIFRERCRISTRRPINSIQISLKFFQIRPTIAKDCRGPKKEQNARVSISLREVGRLPTTFTWEILPWNSRMAPIGSR